MVRIAVTTPMRCRVAHGTANTTIHGVERGNSPPSDYRDLPESRRSQQKSQLFRPDLQEGPRAFAEKREPRRAPDPDART